MPQIVLGIDVGSYSVKIARIERSFKSFEMTGFFERVVQYSDVLSPEESRVSALQSLIEDERLVADQIACSMPGNLVSARNLDLPFGSRGKVAQMVEFEIENHIPFEGEDVVLDYHVIASDKTSSSLFVAYTQKRDLIKMLTGFEAIDINPKWVCVEGVELTSLVHLGMVPPDSVYSLVDIGHTKTTVTVCRGRQFLFTRTIPIGGKRITDDIANALQVPVDEAERIKVEMGQLIQSTDEENLDSLSRKVAGVIRGVMDALLLQIRQTYFSLQSAGVEPVSGLYLSGGTSRLPGIDRFFSSYLKQNVTFIDCRDFHFVKPGVFDAHHSVVVMALALSLRGVAGATMPTINFRRGEFVYKGNVAEIGGGIRRAVIVLAGIVVLGGFYYGVRYWTLTNRLESINREIADLVKKGIPELGNQSVSGGSQALRLVKGKRDELNDRFLKLKSVLSVSALEVLRGVSESLPPRDELQVDIDSFDLNEGKVKMSGRTRSFETVSKIKEALEKNENFINVSTSNVNRGVGDDIKFDASFELKGDEEPIKPAERPSKKTDKDLEP